MLQGVRTPTLMSLWGLVHVCDSMHVCDSNTDNKWPLCTTIQAQCTPEELSPVRAKQEGE